MSDALRKDIPSVFADRHLQEMAMIVKVPHAGGELMKQPGHPIKVYD